MTIALCFLTVSLLTFLLAPRSISIKNGLTNLKPDNLSIIYDHNSTIIGMILYFDEIYTVENNNFYSIKLNTLSLQLNRNSHLIMPMISYKNDETIGPRVTKQVEVKVKYIMYTLNDPYASLCIRGVLNELFTLVSSSFSFSTLWTNNEQDAISNVQYIYCSNSSISSNGHPSY